MLSHLCAATSALYILWITMAHVAGQDDRERTTALKDLLSRIDLDELMKKDEPPFNFPQTLEEFEYAFNEYGQLRHTKTGEPFVFNAREDLHRWNQKRYEALGEIITEYVYELLEKECNMTKAILPVDAEGDEPTSFIYLSPDALSNPSKLLVLIQGSGVVRAGQWARRLIINQDLNSGTQIPFIRRAMEAFISAKHEGDKVIVFDRANVLFIFNFHPDKSFQDYRVGVEAPGKYKIKLDSDEVLYGGHGRLDHNTEFFTEPTPFNGRCNSVMVYIPCRTAIVLANEEIDYCY